MEVHGIPGAPLFGANSVIIDGAEEYGFEEWIEFFKKYTDWYDWSYENQLYSPILKGNPELNLLYDSPEVMTGESIIGSKGL